MLDCSSNGLVARMLYGPQLLKIEPWKGDLAAPMLAHALGGSGMLALYTAGLFSAALSTLAGMVFIMSANITRDVIKLWAPKVSDQSMLMLGYFLIALFLFLPFYWTLVRPPELLSIFMGMAAMGLGAVFFFVTAISYYWKRATKWGAVCTVIYGTRRDTVWRMGCSLQETDSAWGRWSGSSFLAAWPSILSSASQPNHPLRKRSTFFSRQRNREEEDEKRGLFLWPPLFVCALPCIRSYRWGVIILNQYRC